MFMIYKNKLTHAWECAIYSLGQFFQHSETKVLFTQLELITLLRTSLVPCGFPGSLSNLGSMLQPPSPPGAPHAKAPLMASMFSLRKLSLNCFRRSINEFGCQLSIRVKIV